MKKIYTLLFFLAATVSMAQSSDENGRPLGTKPANVIKSEVGVFLVKQLSSTSNDYKLNYNFPANSSGGKIKLFDARRDLELKTFDLSSMKGTQHINLKDFEGRSLVAALYDNKGNFIQEVKLN
jgi:hypothetical protein